MKKLMIAAAVVCAAVMTQAASVSWGGAIADGADWESMTDMKAGQQAYLIYTGSSAAALATEIVAAGDDWSTWTVDNGGSIVGNYTLTAGDVDPEVATFAAAYAKADSAGGVNGYYQMVIFDEDGKKFTAVDAGLVAGVTDSSGAGDIKVNADWSQDTWIGQAGYTGTVSGGDVPEPTSGLLILLGMAGLALRRKQA